MKREMYLVSVEYPGASELEIGIFGKNQALKAFNSEVEKVDLKVYALEKEKDEELEKVYFYYDGTYGLTIKLTQFKMGEMNKLF